VIRGASRAGVRRRSSPGAVEGSGARASWRVVADAGRPTSLRDAGSRAERSRCAFGRRGIEARVWPAGLRLERGRGTDRGARGAGARTSGGTAQSRVQSSRRTARTRRSAAVQLGAARTAGVRRSGQCRRRVRRSAVEGPPRGSSLEARLRRRAARGGAPVAPAALGGRVRRGMGPAVSPFLAREAATGQRPFRVDGRGEPVGSPEEGRMAGQPGASFVTRSAPGS
jgi:hypothetical protein